MTIKEELIKSLEHISGQPILVVGDVMLDHYQWGDVSRISPEAPVPVVYVLQETYSLGGAGNVAKNIKSLGGEPFLIGMVGEDGHGHKIQSLLKAEEIENDLIVSSRRKTTLKTRVIGNSQQIVRVDIENNSHISALDEKQVLEKLKQHHLGEYVLVSDYGKGMIKKKILAGLNDRKVVLDHKSKNFRDYKNIFIMTPNQKEAEEGSGVFINSNKTVIKAGKKLMHAKKLSNLLITLGPEGMVLFSQDYSIRHFPTSARKVYDVTGAGDTVIAAVGTSLQAGLSLTQACMLANYAAGHVVGQVGTAAADKKSIVRAIELWDEPKFFDW